MAKGDIGATLMQWAPSIIETGFGLGRGKKNREFAREQQQVQFANQKALNQQGFDLSKRMWDETNYDAQMKKLKEAGLNPALMYGQAGAGGTTSAGSGGSAGGGNPAPDETGKGMGMMIVQQELLNAQKENIEADTELKREQAEGASETARGTKFDNDVKAMVGVDEFASAEGGQQRALQETSRKERYAAEAWTRVMTSTESGKQSTHESEESRIYKQLQNEYKKAKSELNLSEAEEVIKRWSTELIKDGMPPDSPWYYKLIERFINNASGGKINLKNLGKGIAKEVIK